MTASADDRVCLGVIVGGHGVRGAVKVKPFTAEPLDVAAYGPLTDAQGRSWHLRQPRVQKGVVVAQLEGITDRTTAETLRGTELFLARDRLPAPAEDEYYHADLIGLAAETVDGTVLGTVSAVFDFGAGDLLEIRPEGGREVLVPFTDTAVPQVDLAGGRVVVAPPPGLLDPARPEDQPPPEEAP